MREFIVPARARLTPQRPAARSHRRGEDLEREALQRTHLHHGFDVRAQHRQIDESDVVAGEVEAARPGKMNERGRGGGQRAVPQIDKLAAALVAVLGVGENFFRLKIKEAQSAWRDSP